jgi:hypothetical protein
LGLYHGLTLGRDGKTAGLALADKHAAFPTLIFDLENGTFAPAMLAAVQKQTPRLPAIVQWVSQPLAREITSPPATGITPQAILLPADLAVDPPESLRQWLLTFKGTRLVVPRPAVGWLWVGSAQADLTQAALALRQLAEGQEVHQKAGSSGWMVFIYIIAGLFGLEVLGLLVSLGASLLFR